MSIIKKLIVNTDAEARYLMPNSNHSSRGRVAGSVISRSGR
jgi:hypothetical protein